ncbi:polyphosphate kinase 1 [Paraflavisolibacter sp. H34]|uniref:polyphosphate kinase 1 n=1 Tax=Huijunlia imazamoxiresistens TaxID=3127457 RepID=UPI003019597D
MNSISFFHRDISWLSFNERVLLEAGRQAVPLMERIRFLSIYSSNLDEFFRVRMPALRALHRLHEKVHGLGKDREDHPDVVPLARSIVQKQLQLFGQTLADILPQLREKGWHLLYNEPLPAPVREQTAAYFFSQVLAFLQPVYLSQSGARFFPENNKLYLAVIVERAQGTRELVVLNIPSDHLPRFYPVTAGDQRYLVFLDDIIRAHLPVVIRTCALKGCYSFKVTRDAELNLEDEYEGDLAEKIERQIEKRDYGLATRFLHQPVPEPQDLHFLTTALGLSHAMEVEGGPYHNLKDLASLPVSDPELSYKPLPPLELPAGREERRLLDRLLQRDLMIHTPYHSYNTVLRFFNEASVDTEVEEISVALYRVASDSRIVNALISAAKNGKKVSVFVELKARFDEANNIKWSKKMKAAGIRIINSIPELKVHAKIALVKRRAEAGVQYFGLLATGNLNESTARFYTDHILLTSEAALLNDLDTLFYFLSKREKPTKEKFIPFNYLLVAQFNLQQRFLDLIDREIGHARKGQPAGITIKLNNLEEKVLIEKLYEASRAGVPVSLIVRGICCLVPGMKGLSENITVTRIVDRYLEHGRVFIFHNKGKQEVFLGSADWMNRNIYHRIEVCFPVYDEALKQEVIDLVQLQLQDNVQAVRLDAALNNTAVASGQEPALQSQGAIYDYLAQKNLAAGQPREEAAGAAANAPVTG